MINLKLTGTEPIDEVMINGTVYVAKEQPEPIKCKEWWISPGHWGNYDQIHTLKFNHSIRVIEPPPYDTVEGLILDKYETVGKMRFIGIAEIMYVLKELGMIKEGE